MGDILDLFQTHVLWLWSSLWLIWNKGYLQGKDSGSGTGPMLAVLCWAHSVRPPYLVQIGEVVVSFDQKWLVHPWVVNIVCCCSQQSKHNIQRREEAGELLKTNKETKTGR